MRLGTIAASLLVVVTLGAPAFAGDGQRRERVKERLQNLSPEQKEKLKERLKEKWESLSPEQKAKIKERLRERRGQEK